MKKVAIFGQVYKDSHENYLSTLVNILNKAKASVYIYKDYAKSIQATGLTFIDNLSVYDSETKLDASFDALITLGGDGTILRAFDQIKHLSIPILGINLGRLGFLATIQKDEISLAMEAFLNSHYTIDERVMLNVKSNENRSEFVNIGYALNDLTIAKKNTTSMIGVEAYLNNEYLTTYWADGLIISTPTGSTGYSLSCQGPVIMPNTNNFLITPVAPHNLNARPIVISDDTEIKLKVLRREDQFLASLDSRVTAINVETELIVSKAPFLAKIIALKDHTFINTLRDKLLWGQDTRNKMYRK
ncbi:NAD kinase [Wenyingzhuangia sp. 2_MG-2023]|uniref:NAD kinase n=1 Tax=Wenyingzhuangia sp. 2_MG-2023 TaxID=3062639 RepID=UPI0026E16F9C|nr:NAD kinase [Wenyingzhuangia sp. 2_MG-2023]MDO6736431.1 NAD kinase [Wenyingzhuangia sp. 2_MG-2023]MDO6801257.1 NAD kinase [Wenyingzhuangia sp. 1_MG-2023]